MKFIFVLFLSSIFFLSLVNYSSESNDNQDLNTKVENLLHEMSDKDIRTISSEEAENKTYKDYKFNNKEIVYKVKTLKDRYIKVYIGRPHSEYDSYLILSKTENNLEIIDKGKL